MKSNNDKYKYESFVMGFKPFAYGKLMKTLKELKAYKGPIVKVLGGLLFISFLFLDKEIEGLFEQLGFTTNSIILTAITLFLLTLSTVMFTFMLQDTQLKESIENLKEAMQSINMGWLISETEIIKIEKNAKEIWVFQDNLEKDYNLEKQIGKAVKENLKDGKKYTYFLPIHSFTKGQVKSFENIFSEYKSNFEFVLVANDSIFIHSEIVLYDPSDENNRNAVEFLPSDESMGSTMKYYVNLDSQRANEIWSLGSKLIESKQAIDASAFLLDDSVANIEEGAKEVWVLKNKLGFDIVKNHPIQKAVESNLKKGCRYTYFLIDDKDGKNLKEKGDFDSMYKNYKNFYNFIILSDEGLFIHSEIAIYNPESFEGRSAIELIPSQGYDSSPIYVKLNKEHAESIYNICEKLIKKNPRKTDHYKYSYLRKDKINLIK